MASVVAIENLQPDKVKRLDGIPNPKLKPNITFFRNSKESPHGPFAALVRHDPPGGLTRAHFHEIDEFHIICGGKGQLGRRDVSPYSVHFVRAYTPYGPLRSDKEVGWSALTLRTRHTTGGKRFPEFKSELREMTGRQPWQATKTLTFAAPKSGVELKDVPEIKDGQGLFVRALTMAPHTRATAPDPSGGDGQFVVVVNGGLVHEGKEHNAMTIVFIKPEENAFEITASRQGLEALILNFPKLTARAADARVPSAGAGLQKWECGLCAFPYDEALGMPEDGLPAGTRWQDVPQDWSCPDCSANKDDFKQA